MPVKKPFCISWVNSRGETHSGPKLQTQPAFNDFLHDLTADAIDKLEKPRSKTRKEAQALADTMNTSPEFNNQSHVVVVFHLHPRGREPDSIRTANRASKLPAPQGNVAQGQMTSPIFPTQTELKRLKAQGAQTE